MKKSVIKFLSQLNQAKFPEEELSTFQQNASLFSDIDWNYLFDLIELNAVQVLSCKRLTQYNLLEKMPKSHAHQQLKLAQTVQQILQVNEKRNTWTKRLIEHFHLAGIKLILLKGAYLGKEIYRDESYKKMNDVDLLIEEHEIERGEAILKELGFTSVGDLFVPLQYKKSETHHTPPFIEKNGECVTGLHWNLVSPFSSIKIKAADLFKRAQLNSDGKSWGLSPEDNLLHLCIHLPYYKTGLRELADIANLVNHKTINWESFLRLVHEANADSRAFRVLVLAQKMMHFNIPQSVLDQLRKKAHVDFVRDTEFLHNNAELLFSSRSTYIAKVEKYFIVFKISNLWIEKFVSYMMMWWILLFIPKKELKKINANLLSGTVCLWRALGMDHGEIALILVTVANFIEMIKFTALYPFQKKGRSLKDHPQYYLLKTLE